MRQNICIDQQKAVWFERDFCVSCTSCITTLLTVDLVLQKEILEKCFLQGFSRPRILSALHVFMRKLSFVSVEALDGNVYFLADKRCLW